MARRSTVLERSQKVEGREGHSITQMKVSIVVAEKPKNNQ